MDTFWNSNKVIFISNNKNEKLNLDKIFGNELPVKVEVCSGHGDWIIDKSIKFNNQFNWISIEIRTERVFQIWSKMIFNQINNLLNLGGEGHLILNNYLNDNSIDELFINYPDPPVWKFSKQKLINFDFLKQVIFYL
jgi:tRNA (guanine-N7-)-methyltransferase